MNGSTFSNMIKNLEEQDVIRITEKLLHDLKSFSDIIHDTLKSDIVPVYMGSIAIYAGKELLIRKKPCDSHD